MFLGDGLNGTDGLRLYDKGQPLASVCFRLPDFRDVRFNCVNDEDWHEADVWKTAE